MDFENAKEKAIRYIAISKKTESEVKNKLLKSGFDDDTSQEVTTYLKNLGYINDDDYVDAYIRQCMRLQNYSIYEIKNKLLQKGIKKDIIETKLDYLGETDYEEKIVEKLLNTKLKSVEPLKKKQYLYRRGFNGYMSNID